MPKVLVCYKWVLDESDIRINPDLSVDFSKAKYKISDYDKHTIEAGSQAAKALGGARTRNPPPLIHNLQPPRPPPIPYFAFFL
mgnify:CR=1 FL=1